MTWFSGNVPLMVLVLSLGLWNPSGPVFAQGTEEKAELAERVMDLHREEGYLKRAFEAAVRNAPTEQQAAIEQTISKLDQDAIYAGWAAKVEGMYTIEEMKAYLDYASTDVGRSILRKSTEISAAMQEVLALEISAGMSED